MRGLKLAMDTVWIRTHDDVFIRADSIMILKNDHDGLFAECITGNRVQLTNSTCPTASQLALLEEIRHAGADDSRAVVIMPAWDQGSLVWHRESADTLIGRLNEHQSRVQVISTPSIP
jgi:hypothetical protein